MESNLPDEDIEKEESGKGLRLSGTGESGTGESGSNQTESGQTGSGLRLAGAGDSDDTPKTANKKSDNPWDFDRSEEHIRTTSIASTAPDTAVYSKGRTDDVPVVLKLSQVVLYILFILDIASLAWVCSQDMTMIYANLMKFQMLYSITEIAIIVDLVLVSVMYEFKASLIFFAVVLGFLYPKKRNDHVNGDGGYGGLLGWVYFLAVLICITVTVIAVGKYGNIITMDDDARATVMEVLNQTTDEGVSYGDIIMTNCKLMDAHVETTGSETVVVLYTLGSIYMENNAFVQQYTKSVDTYLAFMKTSPQGKYELAYVELNNVQLNSFGATSYWKVIQGYQ